MSDSRFDSQAFNRKLRKVMTFVLGSVLVLVAVFAICTGQIGIGRVYYRDISVAENPGPFWSLVIFYVVLAVLCFWDLRRRRDKI
jgi:multisubunit Na+/H+ antiporter MnhG subunit